MQTNKTEGCIVLEQHSNIYTPLKAFIYSEDAKNISYIVNKNFVLISCDKSNLDMDYFTFKKFIDSNKIEVIFFNKDNFRLIYDIMWDCKSMKYVVCLNNDNILGMPDRRNKLMNKRIWNLAAINAKDDIECGGWMSSYTREKFTMQEIDDFISNTRKKLDQYLTPEMNILEIGCASGFTMYNIAPLVKKYVGIDMSDISIKRNQSKIEKADIKNIEVHCMLAHEISKLSAVPFDIIILNSIIHCFEGYSYLFDVLTEAIKCIKNTGIIYLGDIMDLDLKEDFIQSLLKYGRTHDGYTKTDFSNELMLSRKFFKFLANNCKSISGLKISRKSSEIKNELTEYRYDVILEITKKNDIEISRILGIKKLADI